MIKGYLNKRNSPLSPPQMSKQFCVLYGTLLLDFESEEDMRVSMSPRMAVEIIGVSEWDGEGRSSSYKNG